MATVRSIAVRAGTVGGLLFFLHGLVPGRGSYPFIWPALAGAVAFWTASRTVAVHPLRHGLLAAFAAGCVVTLIGFVGTSLTVFIVGRSQFSSATSESGLPGRLFVLVDAELVIATISGLALGAAIIGAAALLPVRWWHTRHSGASAA